jgi:hypothetical protein
MKKLSIITLTMIALLSFMATTVLAQNVHLKPPNKNPSYTDLGLQLLAAGNLAGLGNGDVVITVTSQDASVDATCTNPAGQTQPPGQNPAPITVTGAVAIPGDSIKNGNLAFSVMTALPVTPIPGAPGCPNPQWTEDINDLAFTNATITVYQPCTDTTVPIDCPVVLQVRCMFSTTDDGAAENVSCVSP